MSNIRVLKFGGTSMGNEDTWFEVLNTVRRYDRLVIVVSATAQTTRQLLLAGEKAVADYREALRISREIRERHKQIVVRFFEKHAFTAPDDTKNRPLNWIHQKISLLDEYLEKVSNEKAFTPILQDAIASIGEQLSSGLLAECGRALGLPTSFVDARELIKTDSEFGNANPDFPAIQQQAVKLTDMINNNTIPVVGGYYGENENGELTTLGFEGSDYTAGLLGAALNADAVEIWTDVSGIYTCDPGIVDEAIPIPSITFREATELAYFGARVLHPSTLKPAAEYNLPVYVRNIFEPDHPGTKISEDAPKPNTARALTFNEHITVITVASPDTLMGYNFLSTVFETLEEYRLSIEVVTTTEASVSIALKQPDNIDQVVEALKKTGEITLTKEQGLISIVGLSLDRADDLSGSVLAAASDTRLALLSFSREKRNLNLVVPGETLLKCVKAIHSTLFNNKKKETR